MVFFFSVTCPLFFFSGSNYITVLFGVWRSFRLDRIDLQEEKPHVYGMRVLAIGMEGGIGGGADKRIYVYADTSVLTNTRLNRTEK